MSIYILNFIIYILLINSLFIFTFLIKNCIWVLFTKRPTAQHPQNRYPSLSSTAYLHLPLPK